MHSLSFARRESSAACSFFRRRLAAALALLGALGVSALPTLGADDQAPPRDYALRLAGSGTLGNGLAAAWLEEFLRAEGWTDLKRLPAAEGHSYTLAGRLGGAGPLRGVYVEVNNPEAALTTLSQGLTDVALCTRRARPVEAERARTLGDLLSPACEHPIGLDAVAVIVPASSPVTSLTREQLRELFQRRLTSWQALGATGSVHLFAREEKSGATELFRAAILGGADLSASGVDRMDDNAALSAAVAADPRAIGFVSRAFAGGNRVLALAAEPESPAKTPTEETIRSGEYPLSRRLYLYTAAAPENPLALKFARFATGPSGQALLAKAGFLPVAAPPPPVAAAPTPAPIPVAVPAPTPAPTPPDTDDDDEDDERAAKPARRAPRATPRPAAKPATSPAKPAATPAKPAAPAARPSPAPSPTPVATPRPRSSRDITSSPSGTPAPRPTAAPRGTPARPPGTPAARGEDANSGPGGG